MRLKIGKKLKTASHNSKFTGSYKKESEYSTCILFYCRMSITVIMFYIFCLFLDSKQTNYPKIGKVCLFMMYGLNLKQAISDANRGAN